jgi:hypothetical protein
MSAKSATKKSETRDLNLLPRLFIPTDSIIHAGQAAFPREPQCQTACVLVGTIAPPKATARLYLDKMEWVAIGQRMGWFR